MNRDKVMIIIPARMAAMRLPNKPCADIFGKPMIVRVWQQALAASIGPVVVACCSHQVKEIIEAEGGKAVITDPALPRGTDRVYAALQQIDATMDSASRPDIIINLQGDLPTINPALLQQALMPLSNPRVDIATIAVPVKYTHSSENKPQSVKIALTQPVENSMGVKTGRALYFSRSHIPYGSTELYHHIGVYAYRRQALEAYVQMPESSLEKVECLEQLRALEAGMRIDVALVNEFPQSVDTPADLEFVRNTFSKGESGFTPA